MKFVSSRIQLNAVRDRGYRFLRLCLKERIWIHRVGFNASCKASWSPNMLAKTMSPKLDTMPPQACVKIQHAVGIPRRHAIEVHFGIQRCCTSPRKYAVSLQKVTVQSSAKAKTPARGDPR